MPGKGGLKLSGSLGDVMKESSSVALSFLRSISDQIGYPCKCFEQTDVHIHVPSGCDSKGWSICRCDYVDCTNIFITQSNLCPPTLQ